MRQVLDESGADATARGCGSGGSNDEDYTMGDNTGDDNTGDTGDDDSGDDDSG